MQAEMVDKFVKLVSDYIKKQGDVVDHELVSEFLEELGSPAPQSAPEKPGPAEFPRVQASGPSPVEFHVQGKGGLG